MSAEYLDAAIQDRITARIRALMPPDVRTSYLMSTLGSFVLPLLPSPGEVDADEAFWTALTICDIGGREAIPFAQPFAGHEDAGVRSRLSHSWDSFPTDSFFGEVLTNMPLNDVGLTVSSHVPLRHVRRLGPVHKLVLTGNFTRGDLAGALRHPQGRFRKLHLRDNQSLEDLRFLQEVPPVDGLLIVGCSALRDLSGLARASRAGIWTTSMWTSLNSVRHCRRKSPALPSKPCSSPMRTTGRNCRLLFPR
jgi:hypothetical protein